MRNKPFLLSTVMSLVFAGSLSAQAAGARRDSALSFSVAAIQSNPQGAFGRSIGTGYGISGAVHYRLDRAGMFSIRADVAGIQYGNETKRSLLSDQIGGRIMVDVNTSNYIIPMSIGAQVTLPRGLVRPWVNAGVGAVAFYTESNVGGTNDAGAFASTVNHSDFSAMWNAGSGVYIRLREEGGRVPILLDVGAQYASGGRASYLAPGSIVDLPGGEIEITPIKSQTQMVMLRVGVRIGR